MINAFLDKYIFPAIVAYVINRLHILLLLFIGAILMYSDNSIIQLKLGNYTNVCSALVSCIVLLQSINNHQENMKRHDDHEEQLQALHEKVSGGEQ